MARNTTDKVGERHVPDMGVVVEHMDGKFDQVMEGIQGLQQQIDTNHHEFREFREETNYKFEVVFGEFDKVHQELGQKVDRSEFEARVGKLEKKVA